MLILVVLNVLSIYSTMVFDYNLVKWLSIAFFFTILVDTGTAY